ncbi:Peptidyl-prolyl cis-trans isomerase D [Auxenochlorella protothecoides]|uniref:Peptidyl-prolyl cis-trans isomerase D n=1 Tax=Auxenochlorella protothecoides TaxID=3075 RepID=A0A087SA43_AUXPR|nr:Peptidyl-prolyl cis-trans isomerase D [Auxenochlorella protothecoides]KFM22597.1 Peptidyl-prolyl cis-trans isomerase D [Auxenochlorella protothecoides]
MMRSIRKTKGQTGVPVARAGLGILAISIILFAYYQGKLYTGPAVIVYPSAVGLEGSTFQLYKGFPYPTTADVVVSEDGWLNGIAISTKQHTETPKAKAASANSDTKTKAETSSGGAAKAAEVVQSSEAARSDAAAGAGATAKPEEVAAGAGVRPGETAAPPVKPAEAAGGTEAQQGSSAADVTSPATPAAATDPAAADVGVRPEKSIIMPEYEALRNNATLPLVFLDVAIKGAPIGRMEIVLFSDVAPRHAENMRLLCSGEKGAVPKPREDGHKVYHLKGGTFYRIVKGWINQGGANVESAFGGTFADDPGGLALKHDHKGLLSSANMGPNTNEGHFSIMMGPSPHLNGGYTIFGQVVAGWEVSEAINAVSHGQPEDTAHGDAGVVIVDAGQLRKGTIVPDLRLGLPANATGYNY